MSPERRRSRRRNRSEREYLQELAKITQIYEAYDNYVWGAQGYPQEHRPDLAAILPKLRVGDHTKNVPRMKLHPDLKPDIRQISENMLANSRQASAQNEVAITSPDGTQIFSPSLFRLGEMAEWEAVAHESGHAVAQVEEIIWPASYSAEQSKIISMSLPLAMQDGKAPDISSTHIVKLGFREVLSQGEYSISDIGPSDCLDLNELYPLTMELVCANIMARNGDIAGFDSDLAAGRIIKGFDISKPKFTRTAYSVMHVIGWRALMNALKMNNLERANEYLGKIEPAHGESIIPTLAYLTNQDREQIRTINAMDLFSSVLLRNLKGFR